MPEPTFTEILLERLKPDVGRFSKGDVAVDVLLKSLPIPQLLMTAGISEVGQQLGFDQKSFTESFAKGQLPSDLFPEGAFEGGVGRAGTSQKIAKFLIDMGADPLIIPAGKAVKPITKAIQKLAKLDKQLTTAKAISTKLDDVAEVLVPETKLESFLKDTILDIEETIKFAKKEGLPVKHLEDKLKKLKGQTKQPIGEFTELVKEESKTAVDELTELASKKLDPKKSGKSKLLDEPVPHISAAIDEDALLKARGESVNLDEIENAVRILPESSLEDVVKAARKGTPLDVADKVKLGVYAESKAADIVDDVININQSEILNTVLKSKAQTGRALASEKRVNQIIADAINEQVKAKFPNDKKMQKLLLSKFKQMGIDPKNPTAFDKFIEYSVMAKLTGLSTVTKSLGGNTTMSLLRFPEKLGSSFVDTIVYGFRKVKGGNAQREVFVTEVVPEMMGSVSGIKQGAIEWWNTLKGNNGRLQTELTKLGETVGPRGAIGQGGPIGKALDEIIFKASGERFGFNLGELIRLPGKNLGGMDFFYREIAKQAEISSLAWRKAIQEGHRGVGLAKRFDKIRKAPTDEMIKIAEELAPVKTFQEQLAKFGKSVGKARVDHPALKLIIPFFNTPVNLFKQALQRTPGTFLLPSTLKKIRGFSKGTVSQREFSELMGRAVSGSIMGIVGSYAGIEGILTGRGPQSKSRRGMLRSIGWQPNSIKIDNNYYSYRGYEPLSSWFRAYADEAEGRARGEKFAPAKIVESYMQQFAENPFLMGVSDIVDALQSGGSRGQKTERFFASMAVGATVPNILQQWGTRVFDPVIREPKGFIESVKSRLPVLSKSVTPMRNIWGDEIVRDNPISQALGITTSYAKGSRLDKELVRLMGIDEKFVIGKPGRTVSGTRLSDEEYERLIILSGAMLKESFNKYVDSPAYEQHSDKIRVAVFKDIQSKVNAMNREQEFENYYRRKK